jgi:hypothetical protein
VVGGLEQVPKTSANNMIVAFLIHCWCGKPFGFYLGGQQTRSGVF